MHEFSKAHKRRLRELSARLYEQEVKGSLIRLAHNFDDWKAGKITSLQLSQTLHEYDCGESRRIWSKYDTKRHDMIVACAFVEGLLAETEVGSDLVLELANAIAFYRSQQE